MLRTPGIDLGKRQATAPAPTGKGADGASLTGHIDPDGRRVIDSTKMEDQPIRGRPRKMAPVPDGVVARAHADARERGLIGEGQDDRSIEVGCVKGELPGAIEARPLPPAQPRAWVLGTRRPRQHLIRSDRQRLNVRPWGPSPTAFSSVPRSRPTRSKEATSTATGGRGSTRPAPPSC